MTQTLECSVSLTTMNCCVCGGVYAVNERYRLERERDGKSWHCPYCDSSLSYKESETDRLKKQLAQEKQKHDQTQAALREARERKEAAERREVAAKGQVAKLKKRAAAGVCPVKGCKRPFENLSRHMATKHPDFAEAES